MKQTESSDPQVAHGAEHFPVRLADALRDLGEAKDEARDEGFPTPADVACENANRLLKEMCPLSQRRFEIYPMPDAEIAIDASDGQGNSVLLLCDSDGGALLLSTWEASIAGPGIPPPTPCPTDLYAKHWWNLNYRTIELRLFVPALVTPLALLGDSDETEPERSGNRRDPRSAAPHLCALWPRSRTVGALLPGDAEAVPGSTD